MSDNSPCPVCGFVMKSTHRGTRYCEHCRLVLSAEEHAGILLKNTQPISSSSGAESAPQNEEIRNDDKSHSEPKAFSPKNYGIEVCSQCGAGLSPGTMRITDRCPFCNNQIGYGTGYLKSRQVDFIVPFEKNIEFFLSSLNESVRNSLFLPDVFRKAVNSGKFKIKTAYVPFWLFNIRTEGTISYDAAKISLTEDKGKCSGYKHTIRNVSKTGTEVIRNLPQKATSQIDERIVATLAPYKTECYESLNPDDIIGISQRIHDFDKMAFSAVISKKAKKSFENSLIRPQVYDYHHVCMENIRQTPEYIHNVLIPLIHMEININGESLCFAMNGQTGKTYAEFPISDTQKFTCILSSCIFLTSLFCGTFTKIFMYASTCHRHIYYNKSYGGESLVLLCIYLCSWACGLFMVKIMKIFSKSNISSLTAVLAMSVASVLLMAITVCLYFGDTAELGCLLFCSVMTFSIMLYTGLKAVNKAIKNANKNNDLSDAVPDSCISKPEKKEEKSQKDIFYERIKDSAKPVIPGSVITNPQYSPERRKERITNITFSAITTVVMVVISFLLWLLWCTFR